MAMTEQLTMAARLEAAADYVAETREAHEVAMERRNELIAQAVNEEGMTTTAAAKHARVSQSRVMGVLAEAS